MQSSAHRHEGDGAPTSLLVVVYNLAGGRAWQAEVAGATGIAWDGTSEKGLPCADGAYVFVMRASGVEGSSTGRGIIFIHRP